MQKIENITNSLHITWLLTHYCNFSCRYCPLEYHIKEAPVPTLDELKEHYYRFIVPFKNKDRNIVLWFVGGEPAKVPDLPAFCKFLSKQNDKIFRIGFNSNGSATTEYYDEILKYVQEIGFSMHFAQIKHKPWLKKLVSLADKYRNKIHFCVMYDVGYEDKVLWSFNLLRKYNLRSDLLMLSGKKEWGTYTKKQYDYMTKFGTNNPYNTLIADGIPYSDFDFKNKLNDNFTQFKDWKCHVSSQHLYIRDEKLYAGMCRRLVLGELRSDKEMIQMDSLICDGRRCSCTGDLRSTKYAPNEISISN